MTPWKRKVFNRLAACGTGHLGWRLSHCADCGEWDVDGRGCQDRYCASCGVSKRNQWADQRRKELVPGASYFHYVATIPGQLYGLFFARQRVCYKILLDAVRDVTLTLAADPKFLGGTPPMFAVLHTTNQQLGFHPHVHLVLPDTALDEASGKVVRTKKPTFLFPARLFANAIRTEVLTRLRRALGRGVLELDPAEEDALRQTLSELFLVKWNVSTRPAFGGPQQVIEYLARYTYRTAISNARIKSLRDHRVTYTWKDRKKKVTKRTTVSTVEFLRRFAQHILPKGFKRVRVYGLLSARKRKTGLKRLVQLAEQQLSKTARTATFKPMEPETRPDRICPRCGSAALRLCHQIIRRRLPDVFPVVLPIPPTPDAWRPRPEAP